MGKLTLPALSATLAGHVSTRPFMEETMRLAIVSFTFALAWACAIEASAQQKGGPPPRGPTA